VGTLLITGVLVGIFTDGSTDYGCIDALYLLTCARRASWVATRAVWCRYYTWRLFADGSGAHWYRPKVKIHGSENWIVDLYAVCIENLLTRIGHADLINHT